MANDTSPGEQGLAAMFAHEAGEGGARAPLRDYAITVSACAGATLLGTPLLQYLDPTNIAMLYLLVVLGVAVQRAGSGRRARVWACSAPAPSLLPAARR